MLLRARITHVLLIAIGAYLFAPTLHAQQVAVHPDGSTSYITWGPATRVNADGSITYVRINADRTAVNVDRPKDTRRVLYATSESAIDVLTLADARAVVESTLIGHETDPYSHCEYFKIAGVLMYRSQITLFEKNHRRECYIQLSALEPSLVAWERTIGVDFTYAKGVADLGRHRLDTPEFRRLADALYVLKVTSIFETDPFYAKRFREVVDRYRGKPLPPMTEEVRRLFVQAQAVLRNKRFDEVIVLYEQALDLAPWWPEGHFNLAQALADAGRLTHAIIEMRRYLQLAPDAADAREAQDQIYQWEAGVK